MKKLIMLAVLLISIGCASSFDQVKFTSLRDTLTRDQENLANIKARLEASRVTDAAKVVPAHSNLWWQSQIDLISDTMELNSSTLAATNE